MTINKGERPIKRELGNQELKIPAQQNKKGNEKVRSPVCKCVLAYAGDSAFPRRGRRPFLLTFQVEWTMTNTISVKCRERTQSCWNWLPLTSYPGTRNLVGKAMLFLKLCCLSSLLSKGSLKQRLPLWVYFHLFEEMASHLSHGCYDPAAFELKLAFAFWRITNDTMYAYMWVTTLHIYN